jgi:outer membrane protein assembly factor BamA
MRTVCYSLRMTNLRGSLRVLLPLFTLSLSAIAQTYTARQIDFTSPGDFTQKQLEDAAGLHPGSTLTASDLGAAAQRLVDTGYFADVGATIDGKLAAATIKFDLKPIPRAQLLHVGFENFVWLTHDEIEAAVHAKFPMFIDYLPDNSPHQDDIKAALTTALAAKSIAARVTFETFEPTLRHPLREVAFRVEQPQIRVANIKLSGVTTTLAPLVQKSVNQTAHTLYTEGPADQTTAERILTPLLDAGYIQATLTDVALTPTVTADTVALVLAGRVQSGDIFHVSALAFAGTPVFSAEAFQASAKLHPGDIASRNALLETLTPLDAAYRRLGYMDVTITAAPTPDLAARTVSYAITVIPGDQYRVRDITPNGLDPAALADFNRGFLMKAGELYNPEYVATFLKRNTALQALAGYSANFKAYADPNNHTVELIMTFLKAGR